MIRLFVITLLLNSGLSGCGPGQATALSPEQVAGTDEVTLTREQRMEAGASSMLAVASEGVWQLELTSAGDARLAQGTDLGMRLRAAGPYRLYPDMIVFWADTGDYACSQFGVEQGSYGWKLDGGPLSLSLLEDECEDRWVIFVARPWATQP